jgi:serine/threonine protein phosphatase PrpC
LISFVCHSLVYFKKQRSDIDNSPCNESLSHFRILADQQNKYMTINRLVVSGTTHKGCTHRKNDDRFLTKLFDDGNQLLAVSDGLGGHPAGDVAAEDIIGCLNLIDNNSIDKSLELQNAVNHADAIIRNKVKKVPVLEGMGATITAAIIDSEWAWWVHIGDSRMYLMRNGILQQITRDHSFLQDLIDSGDISAEDAENHRMAHVLDQCVGCMDAGVDRGDFAVCAGDRFLFCTDGLYRTVADARIADILSSEESIPKCVDRLLDTSLKAGIPDDTTIIVAAIPG